jgi:hypothetical protein
MRCDKNYITHETSGMWTNNINKFKSITINMIQWKGSDCKDVEIFTHRVGSIGAPSRRTVFIRGTHTKQWEVPKIAGRDTNIMYLNFPRLLVNFKNYHFRKLHYVYIYLPLRVILRFTPQGIRLYIKHSIYSYEHNDIKNEKYKLIWISL